MNKENAASKAQFKPPVNIKPSKITAFIDTEESDMEQQRLKNRKFVL